MFIEPTVLSLIVAKIRGGRFRNMENVYIKGWYLFIIAALIQGSLSIGKKLNIPLANKILTDYFIYVVVFTYVLMLIVVILNLEKKYMICLFIGLCLNLMVIGDNEGKMPVSLKGIEGIGDKIEVQLPNRDFDIKHISVNKDTKLVYLADIILVPKPYPLPKILSLGDVFLMAGVFLFFQEEMVLCNKNNKSRNPY